MRQELLHLAGMVEGAVQDAAVALARSDEALACRVIDGDRLINRLYKELYEHCQELLARRRPGADDLRLLFAQLKISSCLERVGDQAVNLAEKSRVLMRQEIPAPPAFWAMADLARQMIKQALDAYAHHKLNLAQTVLAASRQLDSQRSLFSHSQTEAMTRGQVPIAAGLALIFTGGHWERIGDEAVTIAQEVLFLLEGVTAEAN